MEYPFKDLMPLDEVLEREGYYQDWTHLDPEVFYSLTQISEYIKTKGYGVDVRLLIAQLAEHFGLKTTQVVDLANLLQQKFTNLEGVTQSFTNNINSLVAQMEAEKDAIIANVTVDSEVILARGGKTTLGQRLDETDAQLAEKANQETLDKQQDWYEVFKNMRVKNDDTILIRKVSDTIMNVYINHYRTFYQRWELSRATGLDNSVVSHPNGDAWQVNRVTNTVVGTSSKVNSSDAEMTKSGSWTDFGGVYTATSTGAFVETTVEGTEILLYGTFRNNGGIANLSIDGTDYGTVDFYDPSSGGINSTKLIASGLSKGSHVVRLTVSGTKNELSSGVSIRIGSITGVLPANIEDTGSSFAELLVNMPSGKDYRYGQSAIELAINSTYNGNSVWSGTYHKNLYPTTPDNQKIYIDGLEKPFSELVVNAYYTAKDIMLFQDLRLVNTVDIADVKMIHHFTSGGCHVKWNLTWLVSVTINTSYNAMFGTSVDRMIFGDSQEVNAAIYDDAEHGDNNSYNMIGWKSQDGYIVAFKALNPPAMRYTNTPKKMYYRDRTFDMKMYMHRFRGDVAVGEKWTSEFIVSIAKCNNVNLVMAQ